MPQFRYRAIEPSSAAVEGRIEAASKAAVVDYLHAAGQVPIRIEELGSHFLARLDLKDLLGGRITQRSLALITTQLATLLEAGLALDEALAVMAELVEKRHEKDCLRAVLDRVRGGASLAEAMAAQPRIFPDFYVSMIRAGEAGASLEAVLGRLAEFLERSQAAREHVKSALLYPLIVAVTCCVSIGILFVFVVPRFRPLFEQAGDALPVAARALLAVSDLVAGFWWVGVLAGTLLALLLYRQFRVPSRRYAWDARLLKAPLIGGLVGKVEIVRFSRTLATLLRNGVSLMTALAITRETIRNRIYHEAVGRIIERVKTGKGLAEPFAETKVFPALAVHLIRVGEESGRQDEMLFKISEIFEAETRRSIDRLLALLGPALTVVLGLAVAGVIGTILTAVLSVYDLAV